MFSEIPIDQHEKYRYLFDESAFYLLFDYAFKNNLGKLTVDDLDNPAYATYLYTNILFFTGKIDESKINTILASLPPLVAIITLNKNWYDPIESYFKSREGIRFVIQNRTKYSSDSLSLKHLKSITKSLPEGYSVKRIDKQMIKRTPIEIKEHVPTQFGSDERFLEEGIGFCVLDGEHPVSLASSFFPFEDKLEVEIITVDDSKYRRKGFATAACIALIEYCLENNVTPYWDAQNEASAKLAENLGFTKPDKWKLFYYIPDK
ncbi:MAG: GNAT family N-acetyltransferase [Candidatus Heimdallarchaeota archaeon]|nr:GNAT family N-acetyltransferase [Candidatus Heimdallarchaeota archaeon]MCK4953853.1 GNAT family N-acetyltransferase [Candidatus Heimdallarchaeota archaeon]